MSFGLTTQQFQDQQTLHHSNFVWRISNDTWRNKVWRSSNQCLNHWRRADNKQRLAQRRKDESNPKSRGISKRNKELVQQESKAKTTITGRLCSEKGKETKIQLESFNKNGKDHILSQEQTNWDHSTWQTWMEKKLTTPRTLRLYGDTTLRLQFFYKFYDRSRLVFTFQSFNTNVNELHSFSTHHSGEALHRVSGFLTRQTLL